MTFIAFTNNPKFGYFWGDDLLEFGYASSELSEVFNQNFFCSGVEPWPLFFQSCTIHAKHTNLNSPDDVKLLYPELFI